MFCVVCFCFCFCFVVKVYFCWAPCSVFYCSAFGEEALFGVFIFIYVYIYLVPSLHFQFFIFPIYHLPFLKFEWVFHLRVGVVVLLFVVIFHLDATLPHVLNIWGYSICCLDSRPGGQGQKRTDHWVRRRWKPIGILKACDVQAFQKTSWFLRCASSCSILHRVPTLYVFERFSKIKSFNATNPSGRSRTPIHPPTQFWPRPGGRKRAGE